MSLRKINVLEVAAELDEPFVMRDVAFINDAAISVYLCQGRIAWHRHIDYAELFWVQQGDLFLESDWGDIHLQPHELVVVPKGVAHRSGSLLSSTVLLFQPRLLVTRRDGDRRLFRPERGVLSKVSLQRKGDQMPMGFTLEKLTHFEGLTLNLAHFWGTSGWQPALSGELFCWCEEGELRVETPQESLILEEAEFTIIPWGQSYRLAAAEPSVAILLCRPD